MGDEGPGDLGEFASESVEGGSVGQALSFLAGVALGKGGVPTLGRGERRDVEEASEFSIALLGAAELAVAAAGLVDLEVEATVGHERVWMGELLSTRQAASAAAVTGPKPGAVRRVLAAARTGDGGGATGATGSAAAGIPAGAAATAALVVAVAVRISWPYFRPPFRAASTIQGSLPQTR